MSDIIDIEIGKGGLEVEASGTVVLIIAGLAFVSGLAIGGYIGYTAGSKLGKKD